MKNKYGCIGFVALLGLLGFYNNEKWYFAFFAFAIFFEYFFKQPDELFVSNIRKAAANAYWVGLGISVIAIIYFNIRGGEIALEKGVLLGFGLGIVTFCFCSAYFEWKEGRGITND